MKKRLFSAAGGLAVLTVAVIFFDTLLVNFLAAGICLLALFEIFKAADLLKYRVVTGVCGLFCVLILFLDTDAVSLYFSYFSYLLIVLLFGMLLKDNQTLRAEQVAYSFLISILLAVSFFCLVLLKEKTGPQMGMFYMLIIFGSAWWGDTGAYFVGSFLGRKKLCPEISPNKTVEGVLGGIAAAVLGNVLVCLAYRGFCNWVVPWGYIKNAVAISIPAVALVTPLAYFLGVLGDLSASVIKRQYGIKDFGNIMPGHGGVMDRFDSVLFISPLFYFIFNIYPLISAI